MINNKKIIFGFVTALFIISSCSKSDIIAPTVIPKADAWWNDDVFYEVFVRSFYDSDNNGVGDFQGLIQKLDYLNDGDPNTHTDLGITGIWLMPIFSSPSYHGYDVKDYRAVNPQYGTTNDFQEFLAAAHARGIKVIIDFVINHTSSQHPWFANSGQGATAEKRDWYVWENSNPGYSGPWGQTVWHQKNGAYYYGLFWSGMPDLNFKNPKVTDEIKDIANYWYTEIGIDGFRVDAARHLIEEGQSQENTQSTLDWWRDFYAFQKNIDPGFMTIGEVWTSTSNIIPYTDQRLDYCFEFDLSYSIIDAAKSGNVAGLKNQIQEVVNSYPELQYGTFLTNHDQNRIIEELGGDISKSKLAAGILLTLPGVPYLYYGEEIGMKGTKPDEDIRRPMQWTAGAKAGFTTGTPWRPINSNYATYNVDVMRDDPTSLWNQYQKLIEARSTNIALRRGNYEELNASASQVFSFLRVLSNDGVLVIHNVSASQQLSVTISVTSSSLPQGTYFVTNILSGDDMGTLLIGSTGGFTDFTPFATLEPYASYLLKFQKQ